MQKTNILVIQDIEKAQWNIDMTYNLNHFDSFSKTNKNDFLL